MELKEREIPTTLALPPLTTLRPPGTKDSRSRDRYVPERPVDATRQAAKKLQEAEDSISISYDSFKSSKMKRYRRRAKSSHDRKLDSNLFESLIEELWNRIPEEKRASCEYLDCLWFSMYKDGLTRMKVLSWIKKKQIFSKQYIFVPVVCWSHWSLLILCHLGENQQGTRKPVILLLDSLQKTDPGRLKPEIRRFVFDIYKSEGRGENEDFLSNIPLIIPKVPQQTNGEECGTFVLYFIRLFMLTAPHSYTDDGYPCFMNEDWFNLKELEIFREEIYSAVKRKSTTDLSSGERA